MGDSAVTPTDAGGRAWFGSVWGDSVGLGLGSSRSPPGDDRQAMNPRGDDMCNQCVWPRELAVRSRRCGLVVDLLGLGWFWAIW